MKLSGKRVSVLGLFTALSLIMFMVENLFPPMFIPGARLGLGNIFVMLAVIYLSLPEAFLIVIAKSLLSGIFGGNFSSVMYSLTAGAVSLVLTYLLLKFFSEKLSMLSVGAAAAAVHNLVQLSVFSVATNSVKVMLYAPYLAFLGVISGLVTGLTVLFIIRREFKFFLMDSQTN